MTTGLQGQVAIVTGAGRGFGKAIAQRFAAEGAAVTLTSRTERELNNAVAEIEAAGGRALAVPADVVNSQDVARVVAMTQKRFGPITLLVNNAGVPGPFGPVWIIDPDEWWRAQKVHILAPLLFLREVLPGMVERRHGRIIIVSSAGSHKMVQNMSAYGVGKAAQNRLTEMVATETKEFGIRVFAIDPGLAVTRLAEDTMADSNAQRWRPEMVAGLKKFQADPDSLRDLDRCAQRCFELASGRYDALSGQYTELNDDLNAMLEQRKAASA